MKKITKTELRNAPKFNVGMRVREIAPQEVVNGSDKGTVVEWPAENPAEPGYVMVKFDGSDNPGEPTDIRDIRLLRASPETAIESYSAMLLDMMNDDFNRADEKVKEAVARLAKTPTHYMPQELGWVSETIIEEGEFYKYAAKFVIAIREKRVEPSVEKLTELIDDVTRELIDANPVCNSTCAISRMRGPFELKAIQRTLKMLRKLKMWAEYVQAAKIDKANGLDEIRASIL